MNALLFVPLGLTLSTLTGLWTILLTFALSAGIESWQYFASTGAAQGTDLIMNTLGCAVSAVPWYVVKWHIKKEGLSEEE